MVHMENNFKKKGKRRGKEVIFPKKFLFPKRILTNGDISQEMTNQDTEGDFQNIKKTK